MTQAKNPFSGGVLPPDDSLVSRSGSIVNAAVPAFAVIPLLQHTGPAARCVVKAGDAVEEGMLIGAADGPRSANVHASIPGTVVEIREVGMPGGRCQAVVIELGGRFGRSGRPRSTRAWEGISRADLLARIRDAGVVGLGGTVIPTHLKLALPPGRSASLLVANGLGSEPSLSADYALLREKPQEIGEAIRICRALLDPGRAVLALAENAADLVPELEQVFKDMHVQAEIVLLPSRYPQGHEHLVVASLNGGNRDTLTDSVVLNIGTLQAIFEAVVNDRPLIERVVTVTGSPVVAPRNLKVRLGARIGDLFEECGGLTDRVGKVVVGGPMRGLAIDSLDVPVTKGTTGVMAFSAREARLQTEWPCINCGDCVEACPWDLVPTRLYKLIKKEDFEAAGREGLSRCTECGCCAFACPSHIPLVDVLRGGKRMMNRGSNG
jgi:Na+-translocating ferredoxin:NAD+ oxidoreductase subunit C